MAENNNDDKLMNLEDTYTRLEKYILDHKQQVSIVTGVIVGALVLYFAFTKYYLPKREDDAQSQMYVAQKYFDKDSLTLALNGDNNYPGFLKIIDNYKWTQAANLAHYYVGNIYLRQGKYEDAISNLKKFSSGDKMVSVFALGQTGDAYSELGKYDDALDYYKKAAYYTDNDVTSPLYLEKAAQLEQYTKKYSEAKQLFEELKQKYPNSQQGRDADKYIAEITTATN
jgi:tetratricopeptide (TPR) repeat protein